MTTKSYPHFLGTDSNGDFVWELPTGRWTWGDDPYQAATRQRTFTPDRYLEKYGPVKALVTVESHPGKAPVVKVAGEVVPMLGPIDPEIIPPGPTVAALTAAQKLVERDGTPETNKLVGACNALAAMARAAKGWAEGSAQNEIDLGRRDRKPADEQEFRLADILNMINDAAREVGVAPEYGSVK